MVISYNMARELPRTIRSLSLSMQKGVAAEDYEVIVVDNGSTDVFPEAECRRWIPDLVVHHIADPRPSPVAAVNMGIELARAELVGVCIDGARMASPGLLASAMAASRLHDRPVIGALAFHLGPDLQRRSMRNGYNQTVEDDLLAQCGWEADGYRLFDVSAFAGSSAKGWFILPNETNSLFLAKDHWEQLGGLDQGFESPGGGLANLDVWSRACSDPEGQVVMLLGEATFHQLHGGIATNSQHPPKALFKDEYQRLRGRPFSMPDAEIWFFGRVHPHALRSMGRSIELRLEAETAASAKVI